MQSEIGLKETHKAYTAQKMKFSIKDFFSKCDQIGIFLRIWSDLLKKPLMENFIFGAVISLKKSSHLLSVRTKNRQNLAVNNSACPRFFQFKLSNATLCYKTKVPCYKQVSIATYLLNSFSAHS